jgi:hypothetical protein
LSVSRKQKNPILQACAIIVKLVSPAVGGSFAYMIFMDLSIMRLLFSAFLVLRIILAQLSGEIRFVFNLL